MQALQRNVWKDAWANGSPDDLLGYLKDNTASLRQVLTPQHLQSLETIGKTTKQVNRVAPTAGRAIDTNPRSAKGKAGTKQVRSFLSKLCVRNVANQW